MNNSGNLSDRISNKPGSMDSRKGTMAREGCGGGEPGRAVRRVCPRSKAAHAGSPWITALIESLSDVPWSRVILLPKQLLSSVVYSHLFHPTEPDPRTLSSCLPPLPNPRHTSHSGFRHLRSRHDLSPVHPYGQRGTGYRASPKFTPVGRSILSTTI